ncbi:MAG: 16S rRNA (cytosine(1402)-N(4))-methyltransferase RsmH [Fibrobacterota bacterium]
MSNYHIPVLRDKTLSLLRPNQGGVFIDGTLGGGGHTAALAQALGTSGRVIALDRDADALSEAQRRFAAEKIENVSVRRATFADFPAVLRSLGVHSIAGILLDIGVSSHQFDAPRRGFTYRSSAPLDMRMDATQPLDAKTVLQSYTPERLEKVFREYGEVRNPGRMAKHICGYRETHALETTADFVALLNKEYGNISNKALSKVFQAIRIEVNDELGQLETVLENACDWLSPGGRIAVISYHSLEDRIVKNFFRAAAQNCICPQDIPLCQCGGNRARLRVITRKPVVPTPGEIADNVRARSAKLRVAERL